MVYDAVIPIDIIIITYKYIFIFEYIILSKIISLEKNPDMKGMPIRAKLLTPNKVKVKGRFRKFVPIIRIS